VLCDDIAPLVFVNDADSKSARMFTLAHELVHLWLGTGGIFNLVNMLPTKEPMERFCNEVAAEFLVPEFKLKLGRKLEKLLIVFFCWPNSSRLAL
jgi:Zn-dependent peptidase ImmA (M78 family)